MITFLEHVRLARADAQMQGETLSYSDAVEEVVGEMLEGFDNIGEAKLFADGMEDGTELNTPSGLPFGRLALLRAIHYAEKKAS